MLYENDKYYYITFFFSLQKSSLIFVVIEIDTFHTSLSFSSKQQKNN